MPGRSGSSKAHAERSVAARTTYSRHWAFWARREPTRMRQCEAISASSIDAGTLGTAILTERMPHP